MKQRHTLTFRTRRGEPARPLDKSDDVRPSHDNPFAKNISPIIPLSSLTPFGRAGHAPTLGLTRSISF